MPAMMCDVWVAVCQPFIKRIWYDDMRIYLKNNPAKFHLDAIWNDGVLGFLKTVTPNNKNKKKNNNRPTGPTCNQMSSDWNQFCSNKSQVYLSDKFVWEAGEYHTTSLYHACGRHAWHKVAANPNDPRGCNGDFGHPVAVVIAVGDSVNHLHRNILVRFTLQSQVTAVLHL